MAFHRLFRVLAVFSNQEIMGIEGGFLAVANFAEDKTGDA